MTSHQFKRLTRISYGQLQRWSERGLLRPKMVRSTSARCVHGQPDRDFGLVDAARARVMHELSRRGITNHAGMWLLSYIFNRDFIDTYVLGEAPARHLFALIERKPGRPPTVTICMGANSTIEVITRRYEPAHLIALGEIVEDIRAKFRRGGY